MDDARKTVLVVDDHQDIRSLVQTYLEASNFQVVTASTGHEALSVVASTQLDLVVLDLNLPGCDGFEVCRQVRQSSALPILVLSARSEDLDKILALELGADDYLTKPFNPRELVARVQATFRRISWEHRSEETPRHLEVGRLKLDPSARQAWLGDQTLPLTPLEFSLLFKLASNPGQNLSRQALLDAVWGVDYFGDERTVDAHIRGVRAKLRVVQPEYQPIASVWGVGYRFEK